MTFQWENDAFATDMTLVLGAESYILRNKQNYPFDPYGKESLQTFVDLFLNSQDMYFTLPHTQEKGIPILIKELGSHLKKFSKGAVDLSPAVEDKVFNGFCELLEGHAKQLRQWLGFQMLNPVVTAGHTYRIHAKGERMISESGNQMWRMQSDHLSQGKNARLQKIFLVTDQRVIREISTYARSEQDRFSSLEEFLLCYVFDNYRRGWQYMDGVRIAGAKEGVEAVYFPHILRNHALKVATNKWTALPVEQNVLWSWGKYITELISEPEYEEDISPEKIVEYILAIQGTMKRTGCPKWSYQTIVDTHGRIKDKAYLLNLQRWVEETAYKAGLPLLRLRGGTGAEFASMISKLVNIAIRSTNPRYVEGTDARVEMSIRKLVNRFFAGSFGYRGLLPEKRIR